MRITTINNHCVLVSNPVNYGVGIENIVFSYDTPVLKIDANNNVKRLWSGYSVTTLRDINKAVNGLNLKKKDWDKMTVEN